MKTNTKLRALIYCLLFAYSNSLFGHELFSTRADTVRKDGYSIDGIIKYQKKSSEHFFTLLNKVMYGFNKDLTLEFRLPFILDKKTIDASSSTAQKASGLGKFELVSKLLIFKDYALKSRKQIVLINGIIFPTNAATKTPLEQHPLIENRSIDFLLGIAGLYETLKWYQFASIVYRINTKDQDVLEGNQLSYSYTIGHRPITPEMEKIDWVVLLEVEGITRTKNKVHSVINKNTGGTVLFCGPSCFCSKGNFMLKGALQFPFIEHTNGNQSHHNMRVAFGMFGQF